MLWSRNPSRLIRNIKKLGKTNTEVVINTRDSASEEWGVSWCKNNNVTYHVTESDGTPATGKNSVLKVFLESDNEYMVQVDGDDYLTPHGVELYQRLAEHPCPPDMVVLYRQPALSKGGKIDFPFDKSRFTLDYDLLMEFFTTNKNYMLDRETAHEWATDRLEFDDWMNRKMEDREFMCRMVFHSREVAELMDYNNSLIVGEDTLQFLELKCLALQGKLNILRRKEREKPTYIYDQTEDDSFMRKDYKFDWSWCKPLLRELQKVKNLPADFARLPEFRDEQWMNYKK